MDSLRKRVKKDPADQARSLRPNSFGGMFTHVFPSFRARSLAAERRLDRRAGAAKFGGPRPPRRRPRVHRYWVSEHHNLPSVMSTRRRCSSAIWPTFPTRMRVGSGGIMLPNHAPLRIAEAFRTLEALHPGRIDLGLGRAPGSDGRAALALRRTRARRRRRFPRIARRIARLRRQVAVSREPPAAHRARAARRRAAAARVAARDRAITARGWRRRWAFGFAFAHHFSADWVCPPRGPTARGSGRRRTAARAAPDPDRQRPGRADRRRGRPCSPGRST